MSASFVTPGRRAGSSPATGSQKRVVRSALEVLLDTASPEIGLSARKPPVSTLSGASPSPRPPAKAPATTPATVSPGFTVTYAAAAPRSRSPGKAEAGTRHLVATARGAVREEPSALAFLSPKSARQTRARSAGPAVAATRPAAARDAPPSSAAPETSRNLYAEVERASEEGSRLARASSAKSVSFSSVDSHDTASFVPSEDDEVPLYTEAAFTAQLEAALAAYEQRRDEEETAVLEEVAEEIEHHKSRYDILQRAHDAATEANGELEARLRQSDDYARTLEQKLSALHSTAQAQRERADRLEVALRHEQDAQRLSPTRDSRSASPPGRLAARVATLEAQLSDAEGQLAQMQAAAVQHAAEKQQFAHDCDAIKSRVIFFSERMGEMETVLREKNAQLQRVQRQLADSRAEQQQLRRQAEDATPPSASSSQKVAELEANLQQQTDEVRRRMHRITALEREKAALADETTQLRLAVCAAASHQSRLETELSKAASALHLYTRKPQLWLLPKSAQDARQSTARRTAAHKRAADRLDETQSFADAAFHALLTPSTSDDEDCEEREEDSLMETDDDTPTRARAISPRPHARRARSTPSGTTTTTTAAASHRTHRARTISPRQTRAPTEATAAQATEALREVGASQSACLRTARDVSRALARLHTKTQSFVRRLQRQHEAIIAAGDTTTTTAAATTATLPAEPPMQRKLEDACRTLQAALAAKSAAFEELQTECQLRGEDLQMLEQHAQGLQTQLAAQDAKQGESSSAVVQMTTELKELREHAEAVEAALDARTRECAELTSAVQAVRDELAAARQAAQQRASEWQEKHSLTVAKVKHLETEKSAVDAALAESRERAKELHDQLQGLRSQQATARQRGGREQRELTGDLAQLRQQLASVTALHEANKLQMEKERSEAAAKESQAQRRHEKLQTKWATMQSELLQLRNDHALRCSAEQGTLATLLDMLLPYRADAQGAAGLSPLLAGGTRLFQHGDASDLLGDDLTGTDMGVSARSPDSEGPAVQAVHAGACATLAQLAQCRSEVVCGVQRVLLEVVRLQSHERQPPPQQQPQPQQPTPPHARQRRAPAASAIAPGTSPLSWCQAAVDAEADVEDDKELVLHNGSGQEDSAGCEAELTFVDDDLLRVLQSCCGARPSPRGQDEPSAFCPTTPSLVRSAKKSPPSPLHRASPFFLHERALNAPPPLPKAASTATTSPAPLRAPHAHLLQPRTVTGKADATGESSTSMASALHSRILQSSPSAFAS